MTEKVIFREVMLDSSVKSGAPRIYLHSMPGRLETWTRFVQASAEYNVKHILCLTSLAEIKVKSPEYARAIESQSLDFNLSIISIKDFSTPEDFVAYQHELHQISTSFNKQSTTDERLASGKSTIEGNLLIHCAAGIGRTGCAAICLLTELGFTNQSAKLRVLNAGSGPETLQQHKFVDQYCPVKKNAKR